MLPKQEKASSNNLINRLIKNSQAKAHPRHRPDANQSFGSIRSPSDQKYLVPKIAKEKLKPLETESKMRSRIFTNHLRSEAHQPNAFDSARNIQPLERSRHLIPISPINLPRNRSRVISNLDQSLLMEREFQKIEVKQAEEEAKKYLTPNDFMEILKIDREMSEEFCYMNRKEGPYDWEIVEFEKRNPHEYMVISKRGLTKYTGTEVEFINFETFLADQKIYERLQQIHYFRIYKKYKNFQLWKKLTTANVFKERSKEFADRTLIMDSYLKELLFAIKDKCQKLERIETFYTQTLSSMRLPDFKAYALQERNKTLNSVRSTEEAILALLLEKTEISMEVFMKKMRISKQNKRVGDKKVPLLIGDETGKDMPYTESATLRTHQLKIRNFLKLTDYLVIGAKTQLVTNMVSSLKSTLAEINEMFNEDKKGFASSSWVLAEAYYDEEQGRMRFNPEKEAFREEMEEVVFGTLSEICEEHFQFLHLNEFEEFWACSIEAEKTDEYIEIKSIINVNQEFNQKVSEYRQEVRRSFENVEQWSKVFEQPVKFIEFMDGIEGEDMETKDTEFFKEVMYRFKVEMNEIREIEAEKEIGVIQLSCLGFKQKVEKRCDAIIARLHQLIPDLILRRAQQMLHEIKSNYDRIVLTPFSVKEYLEFLRNSSEVGLFAESISSRLTDNSELLQMCEIYSIKVSEPIRNTIGDTNGQMIGLRRRLEEIQKSAGTQADKFKKEIEKMVPTFEERATAHREKLAALEVFKQTEQLDKRIASIKQLAESLATILREKEQLQGFQVELGLAVTQFEAVDAYEKHFKQVELLWDEKKVWEVFVGQNWQRVLNVIDLEKTRKYLQGLNKKILIMQRELEPNEVVQGLKSKVESFKPTYNACEALMSPELKENHFEQIKALIVRRFEGRQLPVPQAEMEKLFVDMNNPMYSLKFFKSLEVDCLEAEIVDISVQAAKEAELTEMIAKVEAVWKSLALATSPYKEKDTILGNNDELISRIDDNLLAVNNILGSKYVGPIKPRVEVQSKMLRYMQDLIDEWYLHQRNWIYLEPILKSPFAMKNLPKETTMFNQIDSKWKHIMKQAKDSANIRRYCDEVTSQYTLKVLRANNETFEVVQKTLENFLEKKRDIFQRFYFLSNDELLEILSTVKEFEQIEPHLRKVFENFVKVEFDDKNLPDAMVSLEGERVVLKNCIFRGEVEEWFKSAEESMKLTLKSITRQAFQKYLEGSMKRVDWVYAYPSQVVLVVDCIMWTSITEGYLEDMEANDIGEWYETNVSQLNELVQEITKESIGVLERKKIVALITQDVHYRDIVEGLQSCESIHDFKWLQQLRFYNNSDASVYAKQVQSELLYGYEFLGATTRLVITPLTDRCWMTITGALHIKLGANPAGPAGTGKTESCKDLAKSLARYCIVFNCSDQINAQMMEKLFSGLAYTGSWTCLDEFNRIDIEVLSVIAQQVLTIREALLMGKHNRELVLGGKLITLNHDLGIFITMNPGYAGRTELPDNLKMLFRPVAMMVPDYTLIAEIMLFSEGFSSAKELSKKMTKLYKLSSEQLSQQDHYDFGMRAVKSVLVMAGSLKRADPETSEDIILIRAMQDSNIPKFLTNDIPLFNGIIEDLFPEVKIPDRDNSAIIDRILKKCSQLQVIPTDAFIVKNLQLNQTLQVRFGVMLVGPPMGSKTTIIQTLLQQTPIYLNPKAVSLAELYGNFDPVTQTWTDGLAAKILRSSATTHEYVLFDGPVDAIWVENLNTVLDDSMMLCLSNGERIKLSSQMRVLFEVNDLNQASPATVSRCGMVWVPEEVVGWEELISSFFLQNRLVEDDKQSDFLMKLVKNSFKKGYNYIRKFCQEMVKLNSSTIVHSFCKILKNHIGLIPAEALLADTWRKSLEKVCVYAYVWSIGAILSEDSKGRLDKSLSECFSPDSLKSPIQNFALTYYVKPEGQWVSWNATMPIFEFPQALPFGQIFVPTKETFCYTSIVESFIDNLDPVFLVAPTGTGKTSMMEQILRKSAHASLMFTFTAQTSPAVAQTQLESRLQVQRKGGNITLIPPPGKRFIYFIDDVNMPAIEEYGAQPPIEMLRLLLGRGGVWDRKLLIFKGVEGMEMVIAGTHGRSQLPPRFLRFFNTIYIPELEDESVVYIFSELTKGFFGKFKLKSQVMDLIDNKSIVTSTLSLYSQIKRELLPTPDKSHYLFNLRDVARVIQGLTLVKASALSSPDTLVKLWVHEFQRVFEDRLTNESDREMIRGEIGRKVTVSMKSNLTIETLFSEPIVFCHFLRKGLERHQMAYEESREMRTLVKVISDYMHDDTSMSLVLFTDAVLHVCRVSRNFIFEKGHIMLVGLSGSGKKSMITLGSVVAQAHLMMIELRKNYGKAEFREDLFNIMKKAAFENLPVAFLFPENHMLQESFLEDINNLLSSGEVPCMLSKDNLEEITQNIGYELFLKRVLSNLHVCLTLSPIGHQFRSKIRNFPSLVNCCAIDWVDKWPEEALVSVGSMKLSEPAVCDPCVQVHQAVEKLSNEFLLASRRKVYVTPKNYIDLLNGFNHFLGLQKTKLESSIGKLSNGVSKLSETNSIIEQLQIKLTEMKPILEKKTVEQEILLKKLEVDRSEASAAKVVVEEEEKVISEKTEKALEEKKDADRILNEALPTLRAAQEALNTLNRNDISEIKMNQNPHMQVKFTLECVSLLLQEKEEWEAIRKTISDINFISRLKNLEVDSIGPKTEEMIKKKLKTNPNFKPNEIKNINFAAKSLCEWVLAVVNFTDVNKEIVKKKALVKVLNEELAHSNRELQKKRDQLAAIVTKVKDLEKLFNESREQKEQLDNDIILTGKRLVNAEELTDGLKNEKVRWAEYLVELGEQKKRVIGNVFLSTCFIAYCGPYSGVFRQKLVDFAKEKLSLAEIPYAEAFDLQTAIGDNLEMAEWVGFGLPKDSVSIDSGIIVSKSLQNPIMIDPQLQASRWIKNMYKQEELVQLKVGSDSFLKMLESALRMKNPILIETSEDSIEPSIDALLSKEYESSGKRHFVRLGENKIEVDLSLRIHVFTKTANPSFSPEVFIKLCVVNFTVTPAGLEDQLLADVVENELPEIESKKRELVSTISKGKATLQKNEDKILELLNNSKGNILDDVELIANLKESKRVSNEVKVSLEESVIKSKQIEEARMAYQPVAKRGATLYIIVSELSSVQPMYQFSLSYFSRIFNNVLKLTAPSDSVETRVESLVRGLTKTTYLNISRALFNQHKKIFSFMIAVRVEAVPKIEYDYFTKGNFSLLKVTNPPKTLPFLKPSISSSLFNLTQVFPNPIYDVLVKGGEKTFLLLNDSPSKAFCAGGKLLPKEMDPLSPFQNLILSKVVKPELTVEAITEYTAHVLGAGFVESQAPTMSEVYEDIGNKVPLIFILSVGADPLQNLLRLSKQQGLRQEQITIISLGQGQGAPALKALSNASMNGGWVILQNCHLGKSFMPALEKKMEEINESSEISPNFRLFLTCMPCSYFPVSILQNSLKVTSEPPSGIKANLRQLSNKVDWSKPDDQKTLMFSLCFFHSVVLERRKFGSLGWNILYDFNESDLETSLTMVSNLMETYDDPPWDAIEYFIGEIIYGGRVTDEFDRRLLKTLLQDFISPECLQSPRVEPGPASSYFSYIESLGEQDTPDTFGMNVNAQTTFLFKIAGEAMESIMLLEAQEASSNDSAKTISMIQDLIIKVPGVLRSTNGDKKNPDAVEICLEQESTRFNKLITFMSRNLAELVRAVKGEVIMTEVLESTFSSLSINAVPKAWQKKAYPSMKPFASWFSDLVERAKFFREALQEKPKMYWISAFFFPQGFLTSVLQIYARKMKIPVDTLSFQFNFKSSLEKDYGEAAPADGCLVYGLYSEATTVDFKTSQIKESAVGVIESEVPVIHFKPVEGKPAYHYNVCELPLYKTKKRAGTLSTTGHSTNYIISISCKSEEDSSFWIKRGAAFLCALDR